MHIVSTLLTYLHFCVHTEESSIRESLKGLGLYDDRIEHEIQQVGLVRAQHGAKLKSLIAYYTSNILYIFFLRQMSTGPWNGV